MKYEGGNGHAETGEMDSRDFDYQMDRELTLTS